VLDHEKPALFDQNDGTHHSLIFNEHFEVTARSQVWLREYRLQGVRIALSFGRSAHWLKPESSCGKAPGEDWSKYKEGRPEAA
jgi:hypothetical protein